MTFPPCFSSFSTRPSMGSASNRLDLLRHHQQQSRLFSTLIAPHSQLTFEPRSATPDLMMEDSTTDSSQDTSSEAQENMEDNAARMLLALSNIVSKEISADSSCISRGGKKIKNETVHQDTQCNKKVPSSPEREISTTEQDAAVSPPSMTIPKSIEIHNPDWGSCVATAASPTKPIPREVMTTRSISYSSLASPLTPNSLPNSSSTNSFEGIPAATANTTQRYRTVSLAGDELVPDDRELSPLLLPLTAPELSFSMPNATTKTPPRLSRKHQLNLNQLDQLHINLEHEALRRALGAKVFSAALASAAIITPVPENPRPIISFKPNGVVVDGNNHIHITNTSGLIREPTEDRSKRHLPLDLPPLLFHSNKSNQEANNSIKTPARVARSYSKRSSPARKAATKKQHQVAHRPRSKKKTTPKTTPKRQPRQRHTGKKFSWKAYPELEEFLITNREEYLSFSARNYTIEQRDYNNRLTSRLLEHAEANGYSTLFTSCAFSAVRDRIRSYYKSYVQSFKRRRERQEQQDRLKKLEMERH